MTLAGSPEAATQQPGRFRVVKSGNRERALGTQGEIRIDAPAPQLDDINVADLTNQERNP